MPDRSWEQGLHQMIEVKEDCRLSDKRRTLARVTYQRFFRRYLHLAGMTGTAAEVAGEVKQVYGPEVRSVPLHRPMRRVRWADRVCLTFEDKWDAVAESVEQVALHAGRPVLIGTRSVKASQQLSERLQRRGIAHALLNARQDQDEAQIIAEAGRPGRVTVATNMAGRGTDIKLGPGVAARGGLHVILTEYHESTRIDRQLFGRCARQGDPGTCQAIVALDDELYRVHAPGAIRLATRVAALGQWSSRTALRAITALAQAAAERRNASARRQTLKADLRLEKMLAFSGRGQ
jgi:preprotein translocase subunit SecA